MPEKKTLGAAERVRLRRKVRENQDMFKNWDNGSEVVIIGTIRVRRTGEGRRQVHIQENDHRREDGKQHENRSFFCRGCGLF